MWKENVHQLPAFQIFLCSQHSCEIHSFTEEKFTDIYSMQSITWALGITEAALWSSKSSEKMWKTTKKFQ